MVHLAYELQAAFEKCKAKGKPVQLSEADWCEFNRPLGDAMMRLWDQGDLLRLLCPVSAFLWETKRWSKTFSVLPVCKWSARHVHIDNRILWDLCRRADIPVGLRKDFCEAKVDAWRKVFKFPDRWFEPGGSNPAHVRKLFRGAVKTDGVSLCILFNVIKAAGGEEHDGGTTDEDESDDGSDGGGSPNGGGTTTAATGIPGVREADRLEAKRRLDNDGSLVGMDFGRKETYVYNIDDTPGVGGSLSTRHFGHMARYGKCRSTHMRLLRKNGLWEFISSRPSLKTGGVQDARDFIAYITKPFDSSRSCLQALLNVTCSTEWKLATFDVHMNRYRAMDNSIREIISKTGRKPEELVFAPGNANFRHNSRGHPSSIGWRRWVKRMRQIHGLLVIPVNEYNTSQVRWGRACVRVSWDLGLGSERGLRGGGWDTSLGSVALARVRGECTAAHVCALPCMHGFRSVSGEAVGHARPKRATPQVCSACNKPLRLGDCPTAAQKHFVRQCQNEGCGVVHNRDKNAARNMCYVAMGLIYNGVRPKPFDKQLPPLAPCLSSA